MSLSALLFLFFPQPVLSAPELNPKAPAPRARAPGGPCSGFDLFEAVLARDRGCLEKSLAKMNVNESGANGDTPLHAAIRAKNARAVAFFVQHGANLRKENFDYLTPRGLAEALGHRRLAAILEKIERETDRLDAAIEDGDPEAVKNSLRRGASLGGRNVRADSPLHRAAMGGFLDIGGILIQAGADLNARNYLRESPLVTAILRGHEEFAEMLIRAGARVNLPDARNQTALDLAGVRGQENVVKRLRAAGAKHGSPANAEFNVVSSAN